MLTKFKILFISFLLSTCFTFAETVKDVSVELTAVISSNPAKITLNWIPNTGTFAYKVYRKSKESNNWGNEIANLTGNINQYVDFSVVKGIAYEYKVLRIRNTGIKGYGYILAGIEIPANESKGKLILLVDNTFSNALKNEISQLIKDLEGDGWSVIKHDVSRTANVTSIKNIVINDYYNQQHVKALYLLGHIPVPYSGEIYPDGHTNHEGAWPADVYYADIDGIWTDQYVSNTNSSFASNRNIPGDGKFDQSLIPTDIELQVGRVDLFGMPAFNQTEQSLLRNYLNKAHQYKMRIIETNNKAIIDDNLGYFGGEAFSASAYKNFSVLCDPSNVENGDYFPSMSSAGYKWSFGCGGGNNVSANGVGTTNNFSGSFLKGTFTLLYGSYFGDWNNNNNFLRAPLAQGNILTSVWCGRPMWQFHHMALGENIGYSALKSQNSDSIYQMNYGGRFVHAALMGDPSLRNDYVAPVPAVVATMNGGICQINWASSSDNILGYNIYSKNDSSADYIKLNQTPIIGNSYVDSCAVFPGIYSYMVKAIALQNSPAGSYYNVSIGVSDTAYSSNNFSFNSVVNYTINGNDVSFDALTAGVTNYEWNFGDGGFSIINNPTHLFADGNYYVQLELSNACFAESKEIPLSIGSNNPPLKPTNLNVSSNSICEGSIFTAAVDDVPGVTYNWSYSGTGINFSNTSSSQLILINENATSGVITVTPSNAFGNGIPITKYITILNKPEVAISGNDTICLGSNVSLSAAGAENYLWQNNSNNITINVTPNSSTNYYVIGTALNGCKDTSNIYIQVNPNPVVSIASSVPSNSFCFGTNVTFTATSGFDNYIFKNGNTIVQNSNNNSYTTTNLTQGSQIKVTVSDLNACSSTSNVITNTVTNNITAPTITIVSGVNPFCNGDSLTLHSSYSTGNYWSNGSTNQNITVDSSQQVSLFYSLNGCSSNSVIFNAVKKQKVASHISGTTTTCANNTTLNANVISNYGASLTYQWKYPDNSISNGTSKIVNQQGKYQLHIIPADGCPSTIDSVHVSLGNLTKPILSQIGNVSFCEGDSIQLTSSVNANINWSNGATSSSIYGKTGGIYFVTVSNGNCSLNSDSVFVSVIPNLSPPFISANGPTTFCDGYSVTLDGNMNGFWSDNDSSTISREIFTNGTYQVYVTNACGTTFSNAIQVNVLPQPVAPTIAANGSTKICTNQSLLISGNTNGTWNTNNNSTSNSITVYSAGTYFVTTTNSCGSSFSNSIQVIGIASTIPNIFAIGNNNLCNNGGKVFLAGNTAGVWNTGSSNYQIELTDTGNYYTIITNECGFQNSNIIHVGNDAYPITSDISTNDLTSFCPGDSAELQGNLGGIWSIANSSSPSIYAKSDGLYFVKNTNACATVFSDTIAIHLAKAPNNPSNTSGLTICEGYQLQDGQGLIAQRDTSTAILENRIDFTISNPSGDIGTILPGAIISSFIIPQDFGLTSKQRLVEVILEIDSITSTLSNQFDDVRISSIGSINLPNANNVIIKPIDNSTFNIQIPISKNQLDLDGGITKISYTERSNEDSNAPDCILPTTGRLIVKYSINSEFSWYSSASPSDSISSDTLFNPFPGTSTYNSQYFYAANKLGDCYSEFVPVLLKVDAPLIAPTLSVIGNTSLCNGDSAKITGNQSFFWNTDNSTRDTISIYTAGTYFVSSSNACGGATSNQVSITSSSGNQPNIDINTLNQATLKCTGELLQFDASTTNAGQTPTYKWFRNGFQFAQNSATILTSNLQDNDKIYCELTSSSDCVLNPIALSDTIELHLNTKGTWISTSNDNWNVSSNWCGGIPDTNTVVSIGNASSITPKLNGESFCKDLVIASNSKLYLNNQTLNIYGAEYGNGLITSTSNSTLAFKGDVDGGVIMMDQSSATTKSLKRLIISKNNSSVTIGDTLKLIEELVLSDGSLHTNDKLVLISNANNNARIAPVASSATIIGKITAQRFIPQGLTGWINISNSIKNDSIIDWMDDFATSGFTGATGSIGNFVSLYSYNENVNGSADQGFVSPTDSSDIIELGKGYYAYVGTSSINSSDITLDVCGEAYVGDFNFPITYTASLPDALYNDDGWNLIANPYCSAIDWDDAHWVKSNINDAIYSYNTDQQQYTSYVNGVGINGGNNIIEPSQAFWIKATSQNPILVASEAVKTISTNYFFKSNTNSNSSNTGLLKIKLGTIDGKDETIIRKHQNASVLFDYEMDALKKFSSNLKVPAIATKLGSNIYAINNFDSLITPEIPLYIKLSKPGMLTFEFQGVSNNSQAFSLRDNFNGNEILIQHDTSFYFILVDTNNVANRYSIVWESNSIATGAQMNAQATTFSIYPNPASDILHINQLPSNSMIEVVNAIGQVIYKNRAKFSHIELKTDDYPSGIYLIKVFENNGNLVQKNWIKN
jgi:hypothetical protein